MVVYYELKSKNENNIHTSEVAYILGIAKHMWIKKYNGQRIHVSLNLMENQIVIPEDYNLGVQDKKLLSLLSLTGKKCMELLRTFYFKRTALDELTKVLGYPNKHAASVQKYKCLETLRNFVKKNALSYDDFKNNTELIEKYIEGSLNPSEKVLFEAKLILSPTLLEQYHSQKKVYEMVKSYHRMKLREELETLHGTIFSDSKNSRFKLKIYKIFNL